MPETSVCHTFWRKEDEEVPPEQWFREQCQLRDGHRCPVTSCIDGNYWFRLGCPEEEEYRGPVNTTYIIPFSYAKYVDIDSEVRCGRYPLVELSGELRSAYAVSIGTAERRLPALGMPAPVFSFLERNEGWTGNDKRPVERP